jgi:hypothetical protein
MVISDKIPGLFPFFPELSVPFGASELALPLNSECLRMSTFRGIMEVYSAEFFRNKIPFSTLLDSYLKTMWTVFLIFEYFLHEYGQEI